MSNGSTIVQNVIKMALKWLYFFLLKSQKSPSRWELRPQTHVYDMLQVHRLDQHYAQMGYFSSKDILTAGSIPLSKILVECLILLFWFMFYLEELVRQKADLFQGHNWSKIENISKPTELIFETWNALL